MQLERERRLARQQALPPAAQRHLVPRLDQAADLVGGGLVCTVGQEPVANVAASTPSPQSEREKRDEAKGGSEHRNSDGPPDGAGCRGRDRAPLVEQSPNLG